MSDEREKVTAHISADELRKLSKMQAEAALTKPWETADQPERRIMDKPSTNQRPKVPMAEQFMVRLPVDLMDAMDAFCSQRGVRRSAVAVAALRAHLNKPAPADIPAGEKP